MRRVTVGPSGRRLAALGVLLVGAGVARSARAYTVSTFVSDGCHEQITDGALRAVRSQAAAAAPTIEFDAIDRPLVDDLPFTLPTDSDLATLALLVGVRDNDLKGRGSTDLEALALIHGDPTTQDEHCLRDLDDDEPDGTTRAVARCRTFILGRVGDALDHLAPDGTPDGESRVGLPVGLAIRGEVTVALPGFYVRMGQALHALQDSFSHSYRPADARSIKVSLTWLHPIDDDLDESVAGPPHSSALDRCVGLDELLAARLAVADEASRALLVAALGPGTRDDRLAAADTVLGAYLSVTPGCTADNAWCDAPEHAYPTGTSGCALAPDGACWLGVACGLALLLGARRRRRAGVEPLGVAVLLGLSLVGVQARADEGKGKGLKSESPEKRVSAEPPEARFAERPRLGVVVAAGASLNHEASSLGVGGRLRVTPRWLVGLDAEWNPWASLEGQHLRVGAFNAYATVIRRWSMLSDKFDARTSLHVGTSTILFDLYGVPAGTTGLYLGVSLLGLEWRVSRMLSVILDPADVAYPLPQLRGAPFGYLQYRFTLGLQWGA